MNISGRRELYRSILESDKCVCPASVYDPISARIAEDLGFEVGMFAGSIGSATILGDPDLIVLTLSEFAQQARRICSASHISLMVDAEHGYGNALNVRRTVEELENAGVSALTIEDTLLPKSFGNEDGVELISIEEGVGKMKSALDGREDSSLVIAARTSAIQLEGIAGAVRRAKAYERVGVDALFITGVTTREQIEELHHAVKLPLLLGGINEDHMDRGYLADYGVRILLQGHLPFQAAVKAVYDTLNSLRHGTPPSDLRSNIASEDLMNQVTRKSEYNRRIKEYLGNN